MKGKVKKKSDLTIKILVTISIMSILVLGIIIMQFFFLNKTVARSIGNGIVINGNRLDGMTKDEAVQYVSSYFENAADEFELRIRDGGKEWIFNKNDFEVNSDIFSIIEASQIHHEETKTKDKQINLLNLLIKEGAEVNVAFNYIFTGLDEKIEKVISEVEVPAVNSEIIFNPNSKEMFEITESQIGQRVDRAKLYDDINRQFLKTNKVNVIFNWLDEEPEITEEYNKALTNKITEFKTNVSDSTGGRKNNVKLALSKFNGMRLEPNEEISFNKITGPHSLANGYQVATVIYNSRFVDGVGGGICQASTTLYNALVRAGVEILEVNKHTLPVKYVPLACDAMVAEYISDLRFVNSSEYPMFIKTFSDENSVGVEIYGHELPDGLSYDLTSETIKTLPHSGDVIKQDINKEYTDKVLYEGEFYRLSYPRDGVEAISYLQTFKNGKLIETKELRHEIYRPQNGILIEGTEKKPKEFNEIENDVEIFMNNNQVDLNNLSFMQSLVPSNLCP